jgi:DNA-binding HxlR family transcriptional regulator
MADTTKRGPVNKRLSGLAETALPPDECPVSQVLEVIGHRWAVQVLWTLHHADRPLRFRELQRSLEPITQKELTNRLRELEAAGMAHRKVYAEVPPRVEYRMTELGQAIMPILFALADWVKEHGPKLKQQSRRGMAKGAQHDQNGTGS